MQVSKLEYEREFDRAKKYLENRDDLSAVRDLETLAEKDENNYEIWLYLGIAYRRIENYEKAIKSFRKVTEIQKSNEEAWGLLTITLIDQGNKDKARNTLEEAARLNPSDEQILFLRDNLIHTYTKFGPFF